MIDGKLHKQHEEEEEVKKTKESGSPLLFQDALRLPNISLQKSLNKHNPMVDDGYASPTNLLGSQNT